MRTCPPLQLGPSEGPNQRPGGLEKKVLFANLHFWRFRWSASAPGPVVRVVCGSGSAQDTCAFAVPRTGRRRCVRRALLPGKLLNVAKKLRKTLLRNLTEATAGSPVRLHPGEGCAAQLAKRHCTVYSASGVLAVTPRVQLCNGGGVRVCFVSTRL